MLNALNSIIVRPRNRFIKSISLGLNDALFSVSRYPWFLCEATVTFFFFTMGVWLSPYGSWGEWKNQYIVTGSIYALVFASLSLGSGHYDRARRSDYGSILSSGIVTSLGAVAVTLLAYYFIFYNVLGRFTLAYGTGAAIAGTFVLRAALAWILRQNPYRFTIVGRSKCTDEVVEFCRNNFAKANPYVYKPWGELFGKDEKPTIERLLAAKVGDIVLTREALNSPEVIDFAVQSLKAKFRVVDEVAFHVQVLERLPIDEISESWVLKEGLARRQVFTMATKRVVDILASAVALVLLSPVLLLIAFAIKLSSPGPVFFIQPRQARYFEPFNMYKFRSMKAELSSRDAAGGFTRPDDDRVTWIGKFLRPLHLDELPQLLNILLGHMSIVGPRPEALEFAKRIRASVPLYELRYLVHPGLTGHAQLNQGYAMDTIDDTKRKLSYDLYYLCNHTIFMDLQIILRTIFFLTRRAR